MLSHALEASVIANVAEVSNFPSLSHTMCVDDVFVKAKRQVNKYAFLTLRYEQFTYERLASCSELTLIVCFSLVTSVTVANRPRVMFIIAGRLSLVSSTRSAAAAANVINAHLQALGLAAGKTVFVGDRRPCM